MDFNQIFFVRKLRPARAQRPRKRQKSHFHSSDSTSKLILSEPPHSKLPQTHYITQFKLLFHVDFIIFLYKRKIHVLSFHSPGNEAAEDGCPSRKSRFFFHILNYNDLNTLKLSVLFTVNSLMMFKKLQYTQLSARTHTTTHALTGLGGRERALWLGREGEGGSGNTKYLENRPIMAYGDFVVKNRYV